MQIKRYIVDYGHVPYKILCQERLLDYLDYNHGEEPQTTRIYPPSLLEWKSVIECSNIAVNLELSDETQTIAQLNSLTTCETLAKHVLNKNRVFNPDELNGWSVCVKNTDNNKVYESTGSDYVLDLISAMENSPLAPLSKTLFLHGGTIGNVAPQKKAYVTRSFKAMNGKTSFKYGRRTAAKGFNEKLKDSKYSKKSKNW